MHRRHSVFQTMFAGLVQNRPPKEFGDLRIGGSFTEGSSEIDFAVC
ncbi:MAG: hypothetical protein JWN14_4650, partial [Chthonomonadales bacterium]|nr:hypothetical protein [Chthonomonadales bacterium]